MDSIGRDTTAARLALRKLAGSEDFLELLPIGIYCCDREGIIRYFNRRAVELWGRRPTLGDTHQRFCGAQKLFAPGGEPMPHDATPMAQVLQTGEPARDRKVVVEHPDGSIVTALVNIEPLFDDAGTLVGAVNCFQDITALTKANERIREGEQRLRDILNALPVAVYTIDVDGDITFFNEAAAEFSGRRPEIGNDKWCVTWRLYRPDGTPLPHDQCPMAVALREQRRIVGEEAIAERPDGTRLRFRPYPIPLFDENGRMTAAVNTLVDVTDLYAMEIEAAHLAAIVASSDDAIVSKSLDGTVRSWNAGAERLYGFSAGEMIGQPITRIVPSELHAEERTILARIGAGERLEHYETVRVAKDGRRIDVSLTVSPVRDRTGRIVGVSKTARDISGRKRAERFQRILVGELNHRVKNTLTVVQSLARQTMRFASPADFIPNFSARLQALARSHDLLTANAWQGADMRSLLRGEVLLGSTDNHQVELSGPDVTLEPQAALNLSLVIHELATNARKYGALCVPAGRLSVTWTERINGGRELLVDWRESGGPQVKTGSRRGFGTRFIEKSLAAHGGKAVIHYHAHGVACEITLPLPERQLSEEATISAAAHDPAPTTSPNQASSATVLNGKRILIVEDEPIIAMEMIDVISQAGCVPVGPAANVRSALAQIRDEEFHAALLDANLDGEPADGIAAALTRRGISFAFVTGYGRDSLPEAFRQAPLLAKPFNAQAALDTLARLLASPDNILPFREKRA